MSNTRIAKPGAPFRQERYASSEAPGLLANLVAKNIRRSQPKDRDLIWFLQWLSWQPDILAAYTNGDFRLDFFWDDCLRGELSWKDSILECHRSWLESLQPVAETTVYKKMADAINYAKSSKTLVLVNGHARIGKSFAAKDCCLRSAGTVRYVQIPPSNDEFSFFRAFAQSLGVACSLKMKAQEIRARVEDTLQGGTLAVLLDEAHYCFGSYLRSTSLPTRINWLNCALVNYGVPVVLVTTPQFNKALDRTEKATGWTSEQLIGRISYQENLPEKLPIDELIAVASSVFPEGDKECWHAMAACANVSPTHLAAITALASRARWHAQTDGRQTANAGDLKHALRESSIPIAPAPAPKARKPSAIPAPLSREIGAASARSGADMTFTRQRNQVAAPVD